MYVTLAVSVLLVWVIFEDLWHFKIRNILVLALALGFAVDCVLRDHMTSLLTHGAFALLGFGILSLFFALKAIGGGDVKLLTVAILWVGPEGCVLFAVALLLSTMVALAGARVGLLTVRHRHGRTVIPYGPSIAVAWMIYNAVVAAMGI